MIDAGVQGLHRPQAGAQARQLWHHSPALVLDTVMVDPFSLMLGLQDTADQEALVALDQLEEGLRWRGNDDRDVLLSLFQAAVAAFLRVGRSRRLGGCRAGMALTAGFTPIFLTYAVKNLQFRFCNCCGDTEMHSAGSWFVNSHVSFIFSEHSILALKWLAVVLMVVDHINKFVFREAVPGMFVLGRVAVPLFVFVLGYNLARPGALQAGIHKRVLLRLVVFGALSVVPHALMNTLIGGWWPVNIMFTLAVSVLIAWLLEKGGPLPVIGACLVFVFGGALVEFWWPAIAACLFVWAYFKNPLVVYIVGFVASLLALYFVNGNFWALMALPVILSARAWRWPLPRMKWFFYAFYPLHFLLIWGYLRVSAQ